jgi:hypothetical protein
MTEPLVPEPSNVKVKIANEKLKRYKSPGTDEIPAKTDQSRRWNITFPGMQIQSLHTE